MFYRLNKTHFTENFHSQYQSQYQSFDWISVKQMTEFAENHPNVLLLNRLSSVGEYLNDFQHIQEQKC